MSTKSIQESYLANGPRLNYSTAAFLMHVRRVAHAVASAAEAYFYVSKEALYTLRVFFSGPAYVWGTCLTHGEVRGHVRAVVLQQT
jgi:ribosomal protein L35AE/L33A